MAVREKKTAAELKLIVITEIRKYRHWNHIGSVEIVSKVQPAPYHSSWEAEYSMNDQRPVPSDAIHLVTLLQNRFDLA
jgi:hypothetical protein